ncbi:MAG: hypothetical protein IJ874_06725 [Ruminococcus sp.]|nr:hypothetical protein [Ruminococcus sp.]
MKKIKNMVLAAMAAAAFTVVYSAPAAFMSVYAAESAESDTPGTPPDMSGGGAPPERPDGDTGTPPEKPDGEAPGAPPDGAPGGDHGGMPGGSAVTEWNAVTEYTEDISTSGESYSSTGTDENAVLVSGGTAQLSDPAITRTSEDSSGGDNSSFYGVGAAVLATSGTAVIDGGTIDTDSKGGAGIFAYSDGVVYVQDTVINTQKSTSGGIHAAGGGTVYAWDMDITTNGESSAAIRSDRGGGTMVADGGTYTSNGTGSPAIYCTADIAVNNAELNATSSEGVCIEGKNTLYLFDSDLSCNMPQTEQNENLVWAVIVYQSMSGDSEVGSSTFYMDGGSITGNGDIFYTTNTSSEITVKNVSITSSAEDCVILRATGNSNGRGWGSTGANGADCKFTAIDQTLSGDIVYDSISTLQVSLINSTLYGAVTDDETDAGSGGDGYSSVYVYDGSSWIVTADSVCTDLHCSNGGTIEDENGASVTILDAGGNVLSQGSSGVTITVTGEYTADSDLSADAEEVSFSDFAVEKPELLALSSTEEAAEDVTEPETEPETETEAADEAEAVDEDITEETDDDTSETTEVKVVADGDGGFSAAAAAVIGLGAVCAAGIGIYTFNRKKK